MQKTAPRPRHFSMVREFHLADFFTLGNAACGVGAILLAMLYMASGDRAHFLFAAALAPAAFIFDVLDGRIARARHQHSALGREPERGGGDAEGDDVGERVQLAPQRRVLVPCPRDAAVEDVERERRGREGRRGEEMREVAARHEQHGQQGRADAAGRVAEGEEVGEVEAPQHREVARGRALQAGAGLVHAAR